MEPAEKPSALPQSKRSWIVFGILVVISGCYLMGLFGIELADVGSPQVHPLWLVVAAVLTLFLVPRSAAPMSLPRLVASLVVLGALVGPLRTLPETARGAPPRLVARVSNLPESSVRGRAILLDTLRFEGRDELERLTGHRRNVALEIEGLLIAPRDGRYRIRTICDDRCQVEIDGERVIESGGSADHEISLSQGEHRFSLLYIQNRGPARLLIQWDQPAFFELLPFEYYLSTTSSDSGQWRSARRGVVLSLILGLAWFGLAGIVVVRLGETRSRWGRRCVDWVKADVDDSPAERRVAGEESPWRRLATVVLVAGWPLAYLFPYLRMDPNKGRLLVNDFARLYYDYKVYLLDLLSSTGRVPLWSPSEAAGYPFFSNPFPAVIYPLNVVLVAFYKLMGGYSQIDHQVFTVIGVSIFSLGLYVWLRSLGYSRSVSIFSALIVGTSCKITEILRFPNAVHTASWMPWILYGATLSLRKTSRRRGVITVAATTLMMLTAGYPYYVYYLQFLLAPYLAFMFVPRSRAALVGNEDWNGRVAVGRTLLSLGLAFAMPLAICAPYYVKMRELLSQTVDRTGADFGYATAQVWSLSDTLGSLVYPPAASLEGLYYFGVVAFLIILIYLLRIVVEADFRRDEWLFSVIVLGWWATITYVTFGKDSALFRALWHQWPGFSSLRVWPRLNIVLLPIVCLLLARASSRLEPWLVDRGQIRRSTVMRRLAFLAAAYGMVLSIQVYFSRTGFVDWYWRKFIEPFGYVDETWYLWSGVASLAVVGLLLGLRGTWIRKPAHRGLMAAALLFSTNTIDVGALGRKLWSVEKRDFPATRVELGLERKLREALAVPRAYVPDTISLDQQYRVGTIPNWYYQRYVAFLRQQSLEPDVSVSPARLSEAVGFEKLMGLDDGQRFFFVQTLQHPNLESYLADAEATNTRCNVTTEVDDYNGDVLEMAVNSRCPGYLCFIDNWDPDWRATVNGAAQPLEKLFGTFKAVRLERGSSRVRFDYRPLF